MTLVCNACPHSRLLHRWSETLKRFVCDGVVRGDLTLCQCSAPPLEAAR
jgi:hypothetical protein